MNRQLESVIDELCIVAKTIKHKGFSPANSCNYSIRYDTETFFITASGKDKGNLSSCDFILVDMNGVVKTEKTELKPSAEVLLHSACYQQFPEANAILHTHSISSTVLSLISRAKQLQIQGYEIQKALVECQTHEEMLSIPIFKNKQNVRELASEFSQYSLLNKSKFVGYLIKGHGLYVWGETLEQAYQHLDALEFLFQCELIRASIPLSLLDLNNIVESQCLDMGEDQKNYQTIHQKL